MVAAAVDHTKRAAHAPYILAEAGAAGCVGATARDRVDVDRLARVMTGTFRLVSLVAPNTPAHVAAAGCAAPMGIQERLENRGIASCVGIESLLEFLAVGQDPASVTQHRLAGGKNRKAAAVAALARKPAITALTHLGERFLEDLVHQLELKLIVAPLVELYVVEHRGERGAGLAVARRGGSLGWEESR